MRLQAVRLPSRFPVGTRYVVEGRDGRIDLHYVEFPDGRRINLPVEGAPASRMRRRARDRLAARK